MEIIKAKNLIEEGQYFPKWLIMGPPGGGKTTALKTFPKDWKVLVLNAFGNKESLEGAENVDIVDYSDFQVKNADAWMQLQSDRKDIVSDLERGKFPYQVIVADTVTGLIRYAEAWTLFTTPDGKGIGGSPAQHHYRGLSHIVGEFIMSFIGHPVAVVLIGHTELIKNDQTGAWMNQMIMSGARWRGTIYSYLGEVYRAFGQPSEDTFDPTGEPKTEYFWQTQPDSDWPMLKSVMNAEQKYWGKYLEPNFEDQLRRRGVIK